MKHFAEVIVGFGLGLVPPLAAPDQTPPAAKVYCICNADCKCVPGTCHGACPVQKPSDAAVGVRVGSSGGSGTVVASEGGQSLVITNRHVVSHEGNVTVEAGGKTYPARVLSCDSRADLALVVVDASLPFAEISEAEPARGVAVYQWGRDWHGQGKPVFKTGQFVGVSNSREMTGAPIVETTIDSVSGDSGCGVFDVRGRLVAVNWGRPGKAVGQLAVGLGDVVRFLRKEAKSKFPRLADKLASVSQPRPPATMPSVGVPALADDKPYAGPTWYAAGGYADACRERDRTGKTVVILFTDPVDCVPCRQLEAGALADPTVIAAMSKTINVRVDVSAVAGLKLADTFRDDKDGRASIKSWPHVLVYRGGKLVGDVKGNVDAATLLKAITR